MHSGLIIRPVTEEDAPRLLEIYGPYVEHTAVSFDWEVPSTESFKEKIRHITALHPWLVAQKDGQVIGYTYASPFKIQAAYCWSVETSIYIDPKCQHMGVGRVLYEHLEDLLRQQHVVNACACIAYPHPVSIAFHQSMGYRECGHFHKSGYKLGQWQDMVWMEKFLMEHEKNPKPFIPYPELSQENISHV